MSMNIFDVLKAISKRKAELARIGINETMPLRDIKRLYGTGSYRAGL